MGSGERSELRERLRNSGSPEDKWVVLGDILKSLIRDKARIVKKDMLYVGEFLNFCVDNKNLGSFGEIVAKAYTEKYEENYITKVLTVHTSGTAFAQLVANGFDNSKKSMIAAKKEIPATINVKDLYSSESESYTMGEKNNIFVKKSFFKPGDRIFIVDDIIANGNVISAVLDIIEQADVKLAGIAALITKNYKGQEGYPKLEEYIKKYNINHKGNEASLNTVLEIIDMSTTIENIKYGKSPLILN